MLLVVVVVVVVVVFKGKNLLKKRSMAWDLGARVGPPPHPPLSPSGPFARPWNPFRWVFFFTQK